ncbi:MAG: S8 family peptidase [Acidobacteria bacterium]|nr:S8 family peptidase [Acidobacteriota bacterium]
MQDASESLTTIWKKRKAERQKENLPVIPQGIPILLQIDPSLELDALREKFAFEIVAEQEEGYVIVASEDIELALFQKMLEGFAVQVHGSATIAKVHKLLDDPDQADRLSRILSVNLWAEWPGIKDEQLYCVDMGIACAGTVDIPTHPKKRKSESDADWAKRELDWSQARSDAYDLWDNIKFQRENEIAQFVQTYHGEILHSIDGIEVDAFLPDSFTIRLKISGKGLRDLILNYPYIFEVVEPEDIDLPQRVDNVGVQPTLTIEPTAPEAQAPAVCVIDSGIQEGHFLIQPAIDQATSHCFLPATMSTDVGDYVAPAGHGTRVAGAVLYGEVIPKDGSPQLLFWIQNARVLNEQNQMPEEIFPPLVMRAAIERFHLGPRNTRIFNHSINANVFCRTRYMSAWAAEIDALCNAYDVLIVQSAGNLPLEGSSPYLGIKEHLAAERGYPKYLYEPSTRIANPGQSLQALTVGSVAYGNFENGDWHTFARDRGHPSAFSRSGPSIWNVIKPEVVEYGGDAVRTNNLPPDVNVGGMIAASCPELVRSTMFPPGPPFERDQSGTSFAAPKVARIAAQLQQLLPDEPALLYRALIVQSARWPTWAERRLIALRYPSSQHDQQRRQELMDEVSRIIRCIGYGIPDEARATTNTDYRTTFITSAETAIQAGECHIYQVPIPAPLRQQADDFDIRIDVTLSYVAQPRRTRRYLRRYLSTWLDWKSSKLREGIKDFHARAIKDEENDAEPLPGSVLPWTLHESSSAGLIRTTKRNSGTVQKDWAVVKSNSLPDHFCIAVVGHQGWSRDPDSAARYALAVTFEILGQEIPIYEPLRTAIIELQTEIEAESDIEVEPEVEVEVDG